MPLVAGSTTEATLRERFVAKAESLGASVHLADTEAAAAEIVLRATTTAAGTGGLVRQFPNIAARCGQNAADRESAAPDVVAAAEFAIAETGSVAVAEEARDRAACFLADNLWIIVRADQVVATLENALDRSRAMIQASNHYLTFMSGPSRTSDIERTLTIGVHGPRALTIVVVR